MQYRKSHIEVIVFFKLSSISLHHAASAGAGFSQCRAEYKIGPRLYPETLRWLQSYFSSPNVSPSSVREMEGSLRPNRA
jgi:hypothetical protein